MDTAEGGASEAALAGERALDRLWRVAQRSDSFDGVAAALERELACFIQQLHGLELKAFRWRARLVVGRAAAPPAARVLAVDITWSNTEVPQHAAQDERGGRVGVQRPRLVRAH